MTLFTIGYQRLDPGALVALLARHGIQTLLDVRELPLSRRPGFSKTALARRLQLAGCAYLHLVELGCPRWIRHRYRRDRDWQRCSEAFRAHLQAHPAAIATLASLAASRVCALMCYEADANRCHRALVADALRARYGARVEHLEAAPAD